SPTGKYMSPPDFSLFCSHSTPLNDQIRELTVALVKKRKSMDSNKDDDGLLNRIAFSEAIGHTGRISYIPFAGYVGIYDYSFEPAFIRKRNERERQRVRCVNEGYTRLREHLPKEFADKRLSKVETLRAAISYIKHLQSLLDCHPLESGVKGSPLWPSNCPSLFPLISTLHRYSWCLILVSENFITKKSS
uniref:Achaete-scute family bHLH transcription factor 4 n=1 Tax=Dromaius novaehollandiae TaxID=8790 RepID=A0A8C4JSW6_DRONO